MNPFGIALGAASAATVRGLFFGYPARSFDNGVLSAKEQAIVGACADALFPKKGPIALSGTEAGLVSYFDDYVLRLPQGQADLVRLLLWFIEHGTWVFGPVPIRFTKLDPKRQIVALGRMQKSPIYFRRIAFLSMRTILTMGYLANPEVMRAMHLSHDADPFGASSAKAEVAS